MHTAHYARKIDLPGYPFLADETGDVHNTNKTAWTPLQKWLPILIIGCVLSIAMLSTRQAPVADRDELSLLQNMATTDENAQLQLGLAYRDGRLGLKQDPAQANYWLQRSATGGNPYAKQLLGEKSQVSKAGAFGGEVTRLLPLQQDIDHLKSLAVAGDSRAQFELAMRYRDGSWGVERNPVLFREWLEKSAAAGNVVARQELNQIETATR